jgi:hypothetical protein
MIWRGHRFHVPVDGQQRILNHVVDPVGRNALPPRDPLDHAHAIAQQRPVGRLVAGLRRRHPGAAPCIIRARVVPAHISARVITARVLQA